MAKEEKTAKKAGIKQKQKSLMKIQSTQAFLPIRDISDGIIITTDRRFIKILEVTPINFLLRSPSEQSAIVQSFAGVLKQMPIKVQFKVISRKADVSSYIDKIYTNMETEENDKCLQLQEEQINLISTVGAREGISRRFYIIFEYEEPTGLQKSATFSEIKSSLNTYAMRIQNMLLPCGNEVRPLTDDKDILDIFYQILCKNESEHKTFDIKMYETISRYIADSDYNPEKDSYIPLTDFVSPRTIDTRQSPKYIVVDGTYYAFAYIPSKSYNTTSVAGWLSYLINLGEGIDVDLYIKKENIAATQQKLAYALRFNKVKARTMDDTSADYDDVRDAISSGYYLRQGISNGEDFCYMSILLTVMADSYEELIWKMREVKAYLITQDIRVKSCLFRQEEAFLMALPLCYMDNFIYRRARRNVLTHDCASAYPFISFEITDENGIMLGLNRNNNSLVFLDPFDTKKYKNANMAIMGTPGAGKTYTLQCLAMRMRQQQKQVFIIAPDKGYEFIRACEEIGGEYINISAGSKQNINIMEIRKMDTETSEILDGRKAVSASIMSRKIQQLHTFFTLLIPDISYEEKQLLDEALVNTYAKFGITADNKSLIDPDDSTRYKPMPILGDLHEELKRMGEKTNRLYSILLRYITGSASSFNAQTNVNLDNKYIVLDVSELTKEMIPIGMFIVLDYVWDKIKEDRTKHKVVFIDEVWELIGAKGSEETAEFVLEIFKLIRSYGGSAVASTQDLNDFFSRDDGRYGKGVVNSAKIKIIMQLEQQEAEFVQNEFNLSDTERQQVVQFQKGEGLLYANNNHVLIKVTASKTEDELITTDSNQLREIATRKREERQA